MEELLAIIDRFEGDMAVCEQDDHSIVNIARKRIPSAAREGDVLVLGEIITIDVEETEKRKAQLKELTEDLWE
ncbi:MAG TPA: DUF3006 domain-containing protein [Syntrophomonas sp.]|nr:DUF3006 domain-containing protein [Syntrophomonas sp.]